MKLKTLVINTCLVSMLCIITTVLVFPIGRNGYLNLGDVFILLLSGYRGSFSLFLIAGFGSAFADVLLSYPQYAIFTFIIKGSEGFLVAFLLKKSKHLKALKYFLAISVMAWGYAFCDLWIFKDKMLFWTSLGFNYGQGFLSLIITLLISPLVDKQLDRSLNGR